MAPAGVHGLMSGEYKATSSSPAMAALSRATDRLANEEKGMEKLRLKKLAKQMAEAADGNTRKYICTAHTAEIS
jgi:hypothetical protein